MVLKTGAWHLSDLNLIPPNGLKVFSCFHCGGGSSMGYKLSGFDVLGGVEIDPKMMALYRANHRPRFSYLMGVQEFNRLQKLPEELFHLDILDGSPPCSSFSMSGARDRGWGEKKKFREGQVHQVLDDLFFHFIETAKLLKPKVVVAENVKGLVIGKAKGYVKEIFEHFDQAGYDCQLFLLNAAFMGVPQRRERTFFIARLKELRLPKIVLNFNEKLISAAEAVKDIKVTDKALFMREEATQYKYWHQARPGESFSKYHPKGHCFNQSRSSGKDPLYTITSQIKGHNFHWSEPRNFSRVELCRFQSFPDDYNFLDQDPGYVCGMSVPPYMMNRVSDQIQRQWFQR